MQATEHKYPIFEANQVLTNKHLNQVFDYLDEQERLTRANLIGIGIVCGLDIRLEANPNPVIQLSRGCGITSEGYLIIEPNDVALVAYRAGYTVPEEDTDELTGGYPPFMDDAGEQYPLWELFPAGEPGTTLLGAQPNFLNDKAVLLFLELKKEGLRNCSPNDCNDKGVEVTVTVRRLLIEINDLTEIIAKANGLDDGMTSSDLAGVLLARLNLPDLRLPRYDVPNTGTVTSNEVLAAFHAVFHTTGLVQGVADALTAAYQAFQPVLEEVAPSDPFTGFFSDFGFLDSAPDTVAQVRFLQYYYDFFDDLLRAYDEFRWKGAELLCMCCPSESLFPRHLMLGVLFPTAVADASIYRHHFIASSAVSGCEEHTRELIQLFQRLVEMIASFTNTPPLPPAKPNSRIDSQIKITPSKLADVPLSDKAIPYYYRQNGTPALFELWNAVRTRRYRANQNLSYRAELYSPTPPDFVINPLRYDLEPYNFLRVEGHLGKSFQSVMRTLLTLKSQNRLPINIVALRTGAFDENIAIDLSKEDCTFADLEAMYDTQREELLHILCEGIRHLYNVDIEGNNVDFPGGTPAMPLLQNCAPNYEFAEGTVGAWVENYLPQLQNRAYIDVNQDNITEQDYFVVFCSLFFGTLIPQEEFYPHIISIYYLMKLGDMVTPDIKDLDYEEFENRYQDLVEMTRFMRNRELTQNIPTQFQDYLPQEDLIDHFDEVLFSCKLEPIRSLHQEYIRRVREVKQKQFLSHFVQEHPGLQHKAGVPMGGTFVVVYHQDPAPVVSDFVLQFLPPPVFVAQQAPNTDVNIVAVNDALNRIKAKEDLIKDPDVRFILGTIQKEVPEIIVAVPPPSDDAAEEIIAEMVDALPDGTVIADFFLPYICCSDCEPIQFVLPRIPPVFTVEIGCTNPNNQAEVTILPEGGMPPYSVKVDEEDYRPLGGALLLNAGSHTLVIRDAEITESAPQTIEIPEELRLGEPIFDCLGNENIYIVAIEISGGTPPYSANRGTVTDNTYTSDQLPGDTEVEIIIADSLGCEASVRFEHSCIPDLTFEVEVGCTNANNEASVQIIPSGGVPPYEVRVDRGRFRPLEGPLSLSVGVYRIRLRDADRRIAGRDQVVVPPALTLQLVEYRCEGTDTYRGIIQIGGGTPPYTINGQTQTGIQYTSDPIPSGDEETIEVTDQNQCTATLTLQHNCEEDCNLPCDGEFMRCSYRLWLQPPTDEAVYEIYRQQRRVIQLRFNGQEIPMPGSSTLVQIETAELNADYQAAMKAVVERLDQAVTAALINVLGEEGQDRLRLRYQANETDPFGIFFIEHFECETFSIEFGYVYAQPTPPFNMSVRYTNEPLDDGTPFRGAIFTNVDQNEAQLNVPAFGCLRANLCTGGDPIQLCDGPDPELEAELSRLPDGRIEFAGRVLNLPEEEILAWVWDAAAALPSEPFYLGQQARAQLQNPFGQIRLTAITQRGCFGFVDQILGQ